MTALRCENPECRRVLLEADGSNFRIRVRCRRCKRENTFTSHPKLVKPTAGEAADLVASAFSN